MAQIEHPPQYQPTTEPCIIKIDAPMCIGCGGRCNPLNSGFITLEEALKHLLCDECKATLQAFRFLCKTDPTTSKPPSTTG